MLGVMDEKIEKQMIEAEELMREIHARVNKFDSTVILALYMMLLEEWCYANDRDMVETFDMLNTACKNVYENEGKYISPYNEEGEVVS